MRSVVILARGGSKGVPLKNIRRINGVSLLSRAITAASIVDQVVVSSDHDEILAEAVRCGAQCVRRPADLASDTATSQDGLRHAIESRGLTGKVAMVQCTNPFVTSADIRNCLDFEPFDMAVCVEECHHLMFDEHGGMIDWGIDQTLRQGRPKRFRHVGSVWGFSCEYVMSKPIYTGSIKLVEAELPWQVDIDTSADMAMAERLLS